MLRKMSRENIFVKHCLSVVCDVKFLLSPINTKILKMSLSKKNLTSLSTKNQCKKMDILFKNKSQIM